MNQTCPNCGYCPHCGRRNAQPYYPPYNPIWITQPTFGDSPNWMGGLTGGSGTLQPQIQIANQFQ